MLDPAIVSKFRRLVEARDKRDQAKAAAESAENEYRAVEAEVHDVLSESDLKPPFKVDLGEPYGVVSFSPQETYYGRILDEDQALEGFEQRAVVDEMTQPKIVKARLHEVVRERLEAGESMPPGVDFYARRYVKISRQK